MQFTMVKPDDWHLHLRDAEALAAVISDTANQMSRAIVMPNLKPPVVNLADAQAYKERIEAALPEGSQFTPLMTLYLTDNTTAHTVEEAWNSGIVKAIKLYPAGATTNSDHGVTNLEKVYPALEKMAQLGMPLLVHGEVTDAQVDIFDREAVFIDTVMRPLLQRIPNLKVVFEHITTKEAAEFVLTSEYNIAATLTAHHLLMNRNDIFVGGIKPHHYCLPVLKREIHRKALLEAATSGSQRFFLGTDSAPHAKHTKETSCGCAGMYTAHAAIELYAEAFESVGKLEQLEAFASFNGPDFYGLPRNQETISLAKESWRVDAELKYGQDVLVPLRAGELIHWKMKK